MGLPGKENSSSGMIFLIIVVVLAIGIIFVARGDNSSTMPSFDFNSTEYSSLFGMNNTVSDANASSTSLWPSFDSTKAEVFFCPQDSCAEHLIQKIDSAKDSLYIAIYSFTHDGIADAVIRAKERGVDVKVIFDYDTSANTSSDDEKLASSGVSVARRNGSGIMHNKFSVIDNTVVATGSFNYSNNADTRNEENLIFIESKKVAQQFNQDFNSIWIVSDLVESSLVESSLVESS